MRAYVRLCQVCRRVKVPRHHAGKAHLTNNGTSPWSVVSFDVHDMGLESGGFTKVLSFADHFSRGILALPIATDATAEDVADMIVNYLIRFYGKPEAIRSDRGSILISEVIKKLYSKYGIRMEAATAYHHQSVGLVERWHSTLQALTKTHRVATKDRRWHLYLPLLELAYNASVNATTGYSPFFVMHLRHPVLPVDALSGRPAEQGVKLPEYVVDHLERLSTVWTIVTERLHTQALARVEANDMKRELKITYKPGDMVLLVKGTFVDGQMQKSEEPTDGPFVVHKVASPGNYVLGDLRSRRMHSTINEDRLAPWPSRRLNTEKEVGDRYTVERIVDRREFTSKDGTTTLKYRIRWAGFSPTYDTWRAMPSIQEIAPLVIAYNRLVPLPKHLLPEPVEIETTKEDVPTPPPAGEALARRHFRALSGVQEDPDATSQLTSETLVSKFAKGTRVRMLYKSLDEEEAEEGGVTWWAGTLTRSVPIKTHDISYSIKFDDPRYTASVGPYHFSKNTLEALEEHTPAEIEEGVADITTQDMGTAAVELVAQPIVQRGTVRRSPRLV